MYYKLDKNVLEAAKERIDYLFDEFDEVIANGPMRSIIKIKTMNWNTGSGSYALEQYYTAYAHQSYSSCKVKYTLFDPQQAGVLMGCGIKKKSDEKWKTIESNMVISAGPEKIDKRQDLKVDFVGTAIVVKDKYDPAYQYISSRTGNHALKINKPIDNGFEYMIFSAWSEGAVLNNYDDLASYVKKTKKEFNSPVKSQFQPIETK